MKKHFFPFLVILLVTGSVFAQQGINKGKIFTQNKILEGYISISVYDETPQIFSFSESNKGPFRLIPAEDITKVEYDNGITFEKNYINVEIINKDYLDRSQEDYSYPDNAFAGRLFTQKLVAGSVSLFLFTDKYGYYHFFYKIINDTSIVFLPNRAYVDKDGVIRKDGSYKNLVQYLLQQYDCNKGQNVDRLEYERYPLVKVFEKINDCAGSKSENLNQNNKLKINAGPLLGVVSNYVKPSFSEAAKKREVVPVFGGFFTIAPKYNRKSIAFYLELIFINYNSAHDTIQTGIQLKKVEYFNYSQIHISPLVRIYLTENKNKFFFEPGLSFSMSKKGNFKADYYNQQGYLNSAYSTFPVTNQFLFSVGAGVDINRVSFQARYSGSFIKENKRNYFGIIGTIAVF